MMNDTDKTFNNPKVFISYSHVDKEFARQLDASLIANNVETFLDDKEIKIGDSIPQKIYSGIDTASHLIYIISATSIRSKWVNEELSIAKVKEKASEGFRILPVLIDNVELPTAVIYIKYADFLQWRDPDSYRRSLLELLQAMDIQPRLLGREELNWYVNNSSEVRRLHRNFAYIVGAISGALNAWQAQSVYKEQAVHATTVKWAITEDNLLEDLSYLRNQLLTDVNENDTGRLSSLKRGVIKILEYDEEKDLFSSRKDFLVIARFLPLLRSVVSMLDEIRGEVEIILLSTISPPQA